MFKFTMRGISTVQGQIKGLIKVAPDKFLNAVYQEVLVIAAECKKEAPVDTGALRASITVERPERQWRMVRCKIVAGGPAAPYAWYVHENLSAYHEHGKAKFIEDPVKAAMPSFADRVAARITFNDVIK